MADLVSDLLEVADISVAYPRSPGSETLALDRVSINIAPAEAVGILGESGAGKTTLGRAVSGLLPARARVAGSMTLRRPRMAPLREADWHRVHGSGIGVILDDPLAALHPSMSVGAQLIEVLRIHSKGAGSSRRERARELLREVGLRAGETLEAFPHQLSGGQRQRAMIALVLACRPALLVADEPAAGLDAQTRLMILALLDQLRRKHRMALLVISHDLLVLSSLAERLLVLYSGRVVETGATADILENPLHPYTRALLRCQPRTVRDPSRPPAPLPTISEPSERRPAGSAPGCRFAPCCPDRVASCTRSDPPQRTPERSRNVWCYMDIDRKN